MKTTNHQAHRISLTGDRQNNQDRSIVLESGSVTLLAIADGLGGHPRGEVAAQLFIDVCEMMLRRAEQPLRDPERFMIECIRRAHYAILQYGDRQTPPISPRSTAVIAILQYGKLWWAHVGDSRLYLLRDHGILVQTRDHSLVQPLKRPGKETVKTRSSITRCLGGYDEPPEISFGIPMRLQPDDTLLLCTDGLWNQLPQEALVEIMTGEQLDAGLRKAAQTAASRPRSDNVTAIALRWRPSDGQPRQDQPLTSSGMPAHDSLEDRIDELRRNLLSRRQ
jgi:serine/threonine protein phosphatase PrpC